MIRDQIRRFGCGMYKTSTGADMNHCIENGLDYTIYKLGRHRIKKMIQRKHGIEQGIEGIIKSNRVASWAETLIKGGTK